MSETRYLRTSSAVQQVDITWAMVRHSLHHPRMAMDTAATLHKRMAMDISIPVNRLSHQLNLHTNRYSIMRLLHREELLTPMLYRYMRLKPKRRHHMDRGMGMRMGHMGTPHRRVTQED